MKSVWKCSWTRMESGLSRPNSLSLVCAEALVKEANKQFLISVLQTKETVLST